MTDRFQEILSSLAAALERHLPEFLSDPEDFAIAQGNLVFVAISEKGQVFGRFWGTDPVRQRGSANVAWAKANQVKLTRTPTGAYERDVWAGRRNWWEYGIPLPEFIGWEGGLPATLEDGTFVALALSGLRQDKDCALLLRALDECEGIGPIGL